MLDKIIKVKNIKSLNQYIGCKVYGSENLNFWKKLNSFTLT